MSWWTWKDTLLLLGTLAASFALCFSLYRINVFTNAVRGGHQRLDGVEARVIRMDRELSAWTGSLRANSLVVDTTGHVVERACAKAKVIPWRVPE